MKQIITDILLNGRIKTWLEYAEKYNIKKGYPNNIRAKAANDIWRAYIKDKKLNNILVFDVETAPLKGYVWNLYRDTVGRGDKLIDKEYIVLTWSAKWLYTNKMYNRCLTKEEIENKNDSRIVKDIWNLLNKAEILIAHNLIGFDEKVLKARFLKHRLPFPKPYKCIDTLKVVKKHFKLPSYALNYVCDFMGLGTKVDTGGFSLWRKFLESNQEAMDKMLHYNDEDVYLLERLYFTLRYVVPKHPNVNKSNLVSQCPTCGSSDLEESGIYCPTTKEYELYSCNTCNAKSYLTKKTLKCL